MSEITQNTEQQPATNSTPEAEGGQGGARTFTQEEVNRIVSERLTRDRADRAAAPSPADEREQALKVREARLDCREYLSSKGLRRSYWTSWIHRTWKNSKHLRTVSGSYSERRQKAGRTCPRLFSRPSAEAEALPTGSLRLSNRLESDLKGR